ncbi:hypothetical protein [Streptomyces sp. TLI_171]|uniref:hypothetical protein n=1 Tax=Streptomyces sp. TLI_171 TaxID=1938859 RepID=UPI000C180ED2|nr:hypothetical protein [Streptomyces sp. TLI_171]
MASTAGDGRAAADAEETIKLPDPPLLEKTVELPPGADPFATSINLRLPPMPDATLTGTRTIALPTPTPAGGTPLPPLPPVAPALAPAAVTAAAAHGIGDGLRGRILVIEGGYGGGRRWGRGGSAHAPVLSTALAGVAPQILLSAGQVDAVHLPGANDPQTVLAHLRAAARHPGPLLVHLGGHLITDRRGEQLFLSLRENKASESLPWSAVATELRHRGTELDTLVIGDLSADPAVWPQLAATAGKQLADGVPLWATVSHDPDQLGTFTRALIEALHRGRPGADPLLTPELLRQQVHSVLRPDTVVITAHPADRPYFRNTARQIGPGDPAAAAPPGAVPSAGPGPAGPGVAPVAPPPGSAPGTGPGGAEPIRPRLSPSWSPRGLVSLRKAGVPATPPRRAMIVSLVKGQPMVPAEMPLVELGKPAAAAPDPAVRLGKEAPGAPEQPGAPEMPGAAGTAGAPGTAYPAGAPGVQFAKAADTPAAPAPAPVDPLAATVPLPGRGAPAAPAAAHDPSPALGGVDPLAATVPLAKKPDPRATRPDAPSTPVPAAGEGQAPPTDYLDAIGRIVRSAEAGEHDTAAALALALEQQAVAAHGSLAPVVLQVRQVRAHVSRVAGLPSLAAELYRQVATALLQTDGAEHPETQRAATNAEACWRAVKDPAEAIRIAPDIIELRAHLPGPDNRKLRAAERYLRQLADAKARSAQ